MRCFSGRVFFIGYFLFWGGLGCFLFWTFKMTATPKFTLMLADIVSNSLLNYYPNLPPLLSLQKKNIGPF